MSSPSAGASAPSQSPPQTAGEMLGRARDFLGKKGLLEARLEAELLVAHGLGLDRLHLFLELDRRVTEPEITRTRELLVRRGLREPTAYLTGQREFYGRPFAVGPGVLIPRPETERLVDAARERLSGHRGPRVADLGTGSGCLAITLALELDGPRVAASDLSRVALDYARRNAEALGAEVDLHEGDGLAALPDETWDLLICNPPYIEPGERADLAPEISDHEPGEALFAPEEDPDFWVRELLGPGMARLRGGGWMIAELGHRQAPRVRALAQELGLDVEIEEDGAGIPRVLVARAPGEPA